MHSNKCLNGAFSKTELESPIIINFCLALVIATVNRR